MSLRSLFHFNSSIADDSQLVSESFRFTIKNKKKYSYEYFNVGGCRLSIRLKEQQSERFIPQTVEVVQTPEYRANLQALIIAFKNERGILIEGGAGSGKTQAITYLASKTCTPLMRINMSKFVVSEDLLRKLKIKSSQFVVENSAFIEAVQKGYWALIDEANLCSYESIKIIEGLLSHKKINIVSGILNGQMNSNNGIQTITAHPDFRIILTQNPSSGQFASSRT
jgi:midasin (ATPase involved in ribosome maturation)